MRKIIFSILLLYGLNVHGQLTVTNTENPVQLVQNALVGNGVTPLNVKFNGAVLNTSTPQVGHFITNFNPTNLGIPPLSGGLIMASGQAISAPGPNTASGTGTALAGWAQGDADLQMLTTNTVTNIAIIEFDFVATGLELNFDYVFASEEYPEYVASGFNDVFGFFLRGPGITGPFSGNAKNIAVVPNTTIPITINTINNGYNNGGTGAVNPLYYVNNSNIGLNPTTYNPTVMYDGFTKLLRATSALQCGQLYHIKLAIANVGDTNFDSAVFLKNFAIAPLVLMDGFNLDVNTDLCFGEIETINSGLTVGTNTFEWLHNGTVIPNEHGASITIDPGPNDTTAGLAAGTYTLNVYTSTGCQIASDDISIGWRLEVPFGTPAAINQCTPLPAPYTFNIDQTALLMGSTLNAADYTITYYNSSATDALNGTPTGVIPDADLTNYIISNPTATIWIRIQAFSGCVTVKSFQLSASLAPSGNISYPNASYCTVLNTPQAITTTVTPGGVYSATPAGLTIDPLTGAITPSTSTPGNYVVNYNLAASGSCPAFSPSPANVTIDLSPAAPTAVTPLAYCQNYAAPALTTTTGANLLWYTTAVGGTGSATAIIPDTSAPGSANYYVSQTNNGCESPRALIVVNVSVAPAAPIVGGPFTYCQNLPATQLTATGTGLLWYTAATGGTGSATAPTPSTATAGNVTYYVSQTVSGCESPRASILVTTNATPALPTATSPIDYCQNATATVLAASGTGLLWYTTATGGTGNATAPTPSTASVGNTTYYVSQTINGCEGPRTPIVVTIKPIPGLPAVTTPLTYCQNATASVLAATGTGLLWYTAATGGTGNATAPTPSTVTAGSTTYYVSQTTNGCEGTRAAIVVDVLATPAAPIVSGPFTYCQNLPATQLTATGTGLLWYTAATGGTGSATAPTPSTAMAGNVTYYVSQTVSGCESPRANILVTTNATPALPIVTTPIGYCQNAAATVLTASGTGLLWYTTATGGTGNATAPTPSTASVGNTTYYVSQTINGCEGPRASIAVNISLSPMMPSVIGTPIIYCQNATAAILTATGSNLLWYTAATGGTGNTTAPTPVTAAAGTTTYYVSQTTNGCEGPRAAIVVTVLPTPAMPSISPITYCLNASASALTATGTSLLWYASATGGTGSATAPTPGTSAAGSTTYYVSQTINGCEGPRAGIVVTITPPTPAPSVVSPVSYCQNSVANPLTATGSNLLWYAAATGGTGSLTPPVLTTINASTTTYYVSQTISGCEGPRASITINVLPTPLAPAVNPLTYCQNETAIALTAAGNNLLWYTSATGGTGNATAPTPDTTLIGSVTYYVSQTTNACEGPRAAIVVEVKPLPTPTLQNGQVCIDSQTNTVLAPYTLNSGLAATDYTFEWYALTAGTYTLIPAETQSTYTVSAAGVYGVRAINNATNCASAIISGTVNLAPTPKAVEVVGANYFADEQIITVNVNPIGNYQYQLDNGALQSNNIFTNVASGDHTVFVKSECGEFTKQVFLLDYPRYFTPNGDGYNDVWNIFGLSGQANAKIYIFDRFGKLLKEISPSGIGWDGKFNQQAVPSSDYWFIVHYEENKINKIFKSHFALKR